MSGLGQRLLQKGYSRQLSEPVKPVSAEPTSPLPSDLHRLSRQFSEPVPERGSNSLDPRVEALCRQISAGTAHIDLPFGPIIAVAPRSRTINELEDANFPPFQGRAMTLESVGEEEEVEVDSTPVKCLLSPEDEWPVIIVCVLMSLAQGTSMCSCFGVIGYFTRAFEMPSLILYTSIVQAVLTPIVLDIQRRYDHVFDTRFGHNHTFFLRIVGLSVVQALLLGAMPFVTSGAAFLALAGLSGTVTVTVFAKVCMVISCIEGAQAVNFARTACHAGGVIVLILVSKLGVSSQSTASTVLQFFGCVVALQFLALLVWTREHFTNASLSAAYAVIGSQQSYSAKAHETAADEKSEGEDSANMATMFGECVTSGAVLLGSFSAVWLSWTFLASVLNIFGDADLTQSLKLLTFPADTAGRLLSHIMHGCCPQRAEKAPACLLHALTVSALVVTGMLIFDSFVSFLQPAALSAIIFSLCFIVTFDLNELSVKVMQIASRRAQVAHFQNFIFFSSTGVATLLALLFELIYSP